MPESAAPLPHNPGRTLGAVAEELTARWLVSQGAEILAQQWHCRWGELDLVVWLPGQGGLAFVEVKARSNGNWDEGGRLSITPQKQAKLWQAAELFLSEHPQWSDCPCRFDVALVVASNRAAPGPSNLTSPELGKWMAIAGRWLKLQDYIPNAFGG